MIESSGGDSKIKGSASQVAERYQTLARDALAAGDRIAAENYLQHAEHYNRLLHGGVEPAPSRDSAFGPRDGDPADGEAISVNESSVPEGPDPKSPSA